MLEDLNKLAEYIEKLAQFTQELRIENRNLSEQLAQQKAQNAGASAQTKQLEEESLQFRAEIERLEKAYLLVQTQLADKSKENDKLRQGLMMAIEKIHQIVSTLPEQVRQEPLKVADIGLGTAPLSAYTDIPSIAPNHEHSRPAPQPEIIPLTGNASRWS